MYGNNGPDITLLLLLACTSTFAKWRFLNCIKIVCTFHHNLMICQSSDTELTKLSLHYSKFVEKSLERIDFRLDVSCKTKDAHIEHL